MQLQTEYEKFCLENAAYFTAIRGRNPRKRFRAEADTLEGAKAEGLGDHKTMICAVTATGQSAHICNA